MPQVINELPGLGELLGSGLGSGIGGSLNQLAQMKLNQLSQRQQAGAYQNLGLPQYLAEALSQISPQERFDIFQRLQPEDFSQQVQNPNQGIHALQQSMAPQKEEQLMRTADSQKNSPMQNMPSQHVPILARPSASQKADQVKAQRAEQIRIDKETEPYYKEVLAKEESAKNGDIRLNKMEKLIKKGGLPISAIYNVLKNLEEVPPSHAGTAGGYLFGPIGAAIGGLISPIATVLRGIQRRTSPNTEEFEKLSADFVKEAKAIFGSRITDADLKAFMNTIPNLSQSDEGKLKIIQNVKSFNDAARIKAKALKQIIKENGGKRPANLQILVEERAKPELDKLSQEFVA